MKVRAWVQEKREELIEDIKTLVAIRSISCPGGDGEPFGSGCSQVLEAALAMAARYGLLTENCDGYCGTARLEGQGKQEIGIFSHLDVVPEGGNWTKTNPYEPVVINGWLYGRGSADNKGASVAALYAMRFLRENEIPLKHSVCQFFGCDEERGMEDIDYYLKYHQPPQFSLVPDAAFPVCYGEKGRYRLRCHTEFSEDVLSFWGGEGENSVPERAGIVFRGIKEACAEIAGICVTLEDGNTCVKAAGLAAHAAKPGVGKSALFILAEYLVHNKWLGEKDRKKFEFLIRLCGDSSGIPFGIECSDEESGALTMVGSLLSFEDRMVTLCIDIRYPVSADPVWILEGLKNQLSSSCWDVLDIKHSPSFCRNKEDRTIKTLTDISNRIQNVNLSPYCMSGGTYARKLPSAVGYGPGVAGQKKPCAEGHGYGHQPDECVCIDYLLNAVEIYVEAILSLDEMVGKFNCNLI